MRAAVGAVGDVFGGDEVLKGGEAHVRDVHTAEESVPVAVIRLAAMQVVLGGEPLCPSRHGGDLGTGAQHLLVEIVDLAVLHLEVAPEAAAQIARLRTLRILRCMQHRPKDL